MEDEDGESKVMDMWSILGEQQLKDSTLGNTLKHSVDGTYTDVIEEEKQVLKYNSVGTKESPGKNSPGSKIVFKGFKKRILAQAQETQTITSRSASQEQQTPHPNVSPKNSKEKRSEAKRGKITEYAQYLGLQPSSKYKCTKCNSSTNFCSNVKQNLCTCNSTMTPMPSTSESSSVPHSANFKITRKVYLCAACGTYFENWNLFLHMRDIHKRHICLFCLGMFGQAERLSYHLTKKHSVPEMSFASVEDFYGAFKGSCYLVCCTCEKVFSETDNFYNHFCSPPPKQDVPASVCTLCRQTGSHASTCSLAIEASKEQNTTFSIGMQTEPASPHVLDKPANAVTDTFKTRKVVKNNKSKYVEDGIPNSHQGKLMNMHTKKANVKTPPQSESQQPNDEVPPDTNSQNDAAHNSVRDTVSETIMEVSRYVEDSCEESEEKAERQICEDRDSEVKPSDNESNDKLYDSVTQTIMEVSRCTNDGEELEDIHEKDDSGSTDALDTSDKQDTEDSEDGSKPDKEPSSPGRESPSRLEESSPERSKEPGDETERSGKPVETESEAKADSESQASSSPAHSPVSRSLFSPQHEPQPTELHSKEDCSKAEAEGEKPATPTESQAAVSFNAVPSSDRSLVIKICTNRNSQFSVTSSSAVEDKTENHDGSGEEEPETAKDEEASALDEHRSSQAERQKESNGGYTVNEIDSDSDSFKLAVVDTSDQEPEEAEEAEEADGTAESKTVSSLEHRHTELSHSEEREGGEGVANANTNGSQDSETENAEQDERKDGQQLTQASDGITLAGEDVPCVDLNVEGTLDSIEIEDLLKRCIETASPFCVYCNHARHIAVDGKQLGLHMLGEHRFQPQHPAIIIQQEQFTARVKKSLDELEFRFFNLNSYNSTNGTYNVSNVRTYECFHCRFHSAVHKELYLHNRKMHQKTILICIMCKSTFYSYSELLCHLCPGIYSPNINVRYRCCLCPVTNLPSAFRLMVHLRKRHHACDVCLESTGNQQRLSNHVWKHKLHHLCYRCGIAYRNKPDITKHLFWKHGTESVLCKKCLQKKWPHIYHFCIPPTAFVCEECGSSFSRAVALKVHKRLHSGDQPYTCAECSERFISQKLLTKHEATHREQPAIDVTMTDPVGQQPTVDEEKADREKAAVAENTAVPSEPVKEVKEPVKKVVDVYDLPPLNLSSESDTDSEEEKPSESKDTENAEKSNKPVEQEKAEASPTEPAKPSSPVPLTDSIVDVEQNEEEKKHEAQIMDGIWDNFKSYTASLEMKESASNFPIKEPEPETDVAFLRSIVLADHDYCVVWSEKEKNSSSGEPASKEYCTTKGGAEESLTADQDYVNRLPRSPTGNNVLQNSGENDPSKKKPKTPKKKKQSGSTSSSDSSSDSDSSSCSCGTNCSCSSSSSGSSSSSSSSSDSDSSGSESSPRKQSSRKERKKEKEVCQESASGATESAERKETPAETENGEQIVSVEPVCPPKPLLRESDLETDETETDEDFYDEHPQQLANKLLAEKRNQLLLLAAVAPASTESSIPLNNGLTETDSVAPSPDPIPSGVEEQQQPQQQQKKKVKTKKRKKGERAKQRGSGGGGGCATPTVESIKLNIPKAYYQKNPAFSTSSPAAAITLQPSRTSTPNLSVNDIHGTSTGGIAEGQAMSAMNQSIGGSGSETETKRSSKRKRIPKRFYGDSSDEDTTEKQPAIKWRKVEAASFVPAPSPIKPIPPRLSFGGKGLAYSRPVGTESEQPAESVTVAPASATESEEPEPESSSDSSDSEVESSSQQPSHQIPEPVVAPVPERTVNLYCYCQCPYDEVSEMIACDGEDCRIEWFHFECVGIMVPPKGKWYCPDCRKKHGIVENSEDYFD